MTDSYLDYWRIFVIYFFVIWFCCICTIFGPNHISARGPDNDLDFAAHLVSEGKYFYTYSISCILQVVLTKGLTQIHSSQLQPATLDSHRLSQVRQISLNSASLIDWLIDWLIEYTSKSMRPSKDYSRLHWLNTKCQKDSTLFFHSHIIMNKQYLYSMKQSNLV